MIFYPSSVLSTMWPSFSQYACLDFCIFGVWLWLWALCKRDFPLNSAHWTWLYHFQGWYSLKYSLFSESSLKRKMTHCEYKSLFPALWFTENVFFTGNTVSKMKGYNVPAFHPSSFMKTQSTWCQLWWTHYNNSKTRHRLGCTLAGGKCWTFCLLLLIDTGRKKIPGVLWLTLCLFQCLQFTGILQ